MDAALHQDRATRPAPVGDSAGRQTRLVIGTFLGALLLLAAIGTLAYFNVRRSVETGQWVDHTYEVIITARQIFSDQRGAAATARGYLLTGNDEFLQRYAEYRSATLRDLDSFASLVRDNPQQTQRLPEMRAVTGSLLQRLDRTIALRTPGTRAIAPEAMGPVMEGHADMDRLVELTSELVSSENALLAERRDQAARGHRLTLVILAGGGLLSLGVLLACLGLLATEIRRRRRIETRVRLLNAELSERNQMLEASNRELEGFSYTVSHDLRTPLRAIDGFSNLLEKQYGMNLDPEAARLLSVVRDSSARMARLIDDLLEFSRLGRKPLQMAEVDMRELVDECVAEVLRGSPVRPAVKIGAVPPCRGDRRLLRQVWLNLIDNAVKYSSRSTNARIQIEGGEKAGECVYSVRDNGVGFDMQYYDKLFGVFHRLHAMDDFPGTGVGLAIAMRVITRHGGRLWAEAAVDRGATFHFSLPKQEGA